MKIKVVLHHISIIVLLAGLLTACGGGDSGGSSSADSFAVDGGGIKGPMAHSDVMAYAFDGSKADFLGRSLQKKMGRTNKAAALTGLSLTSKDKKATPIILKFASNDDTVDLTTGLKPQAPADITRLRTVISDEAFALVEGGDQPIYATPLTTVAVELATARTGQDASKEQFGTALQQAAREVVGAFGFGMSPGTDIYLAAPLVNDQTQGMAKQAAVAEYRTAIEVLGAVVQELYTTAKANNPQTAVTSDRILAALGVDLADGIIDGRNKGTVISALQDISDIASVLDLDLAQQHVPGRRDVPLADVERLLVEELNQTGFSEVDVSYLQDVIDIVPTNTMLAFLAGGKARLAADDEASGGSNGNSVSGSGSDSNGAPSVSGTVVTTGSAGSSNQSGTASEPDSAGQVASNGTESTAASEGTAGSAGSSGQSGTVSQPESTDPVVSNGTAAVPDDTGTIGATGSSSQSGTASETEFADSVENEDSALAATDGPITVNGSGVKGPLANALVTVYAFDPDQEDFKKQPAIADARTNDAAAIVDLRLPSNTKNPVLPLIFEFSSDAQTTDLTTGEAPVIKVLRTAVTAETIEDIRAGKPVFATPLTTLAVDMAIIHSGPGATAQTFADNLDVAAGYVVSTLGFGMSQAVDIFKTPPVLSANDTSLNAQSLIAELRTSVEAMAAIVVELQKSIQSTNPGSSVSPGQILSALADDLSDGVINGLKDGDVIAALRDVSDIAAIITVDPSTLVVPGTEVSLNDIEQILIAEAALTCDCDPATVNNYLADGSIDVLPKPVSLEITSSVEATLISVESLSSTLFKLTFSNPLNFESASDVNNYQILGEDGNPLDIESARLGSESNTVLLTTAPQGDMSYKVFVSNIIESQQPENGSSVIVSGTPVLDLSLKTAVATSNTRLVLTFSEAVETTSAADIGNYQILSVVDGKQLNVKGAALDANGTTLTLITDSQQDIGYTVSASNVTALNGDQPIGSPHDTLNFLGSYNTATLPDAPAVVGAISTGNTTVLITFSSAMSDEAEDPLHYSIVQENVNSEAGALAVTGASFYGSDRNTVMLTTRSQSEVSYQVTAVNVQDMHGQQIRKENSNFGYNTADTADFPGTPPGGGSLADLDFDGDGLLDNEEQRGWLIRIVHTDGEIEEREVTSDPTEKDTDGDGLDDRLERSLNIDPRTGDSDADSLGDAHEYNGIFSSPSMQDTDSDGLFDGEEVTFYKTSPVLDDTDGDQIPDGEEVVLANRNARIADLPQPAFDIESITLELDVRFDKTLEQTTTKGEAKTISTTLTQAREKSHSESHEAMAKVHAQYTYTNQLAIPSGGDSSSLFPFPKHTTTHQLEVGAEASYTGTWSKSSVESTQKEYNRSLTTEEQASEGETVSRHIESARVSTLLYLKAKGDVAFTISDLQITALVPDIRNPGQFKPLATLTPEAGSNGELPNSFHLGPLADKIGPLVFTNDDVFPAEVERLQRDPTGVVFRISNYTIEDESGRKFAFSSQDVVDRTTTFVFDYGGVKKKEGEEEKEELLGDSTEFYRVATSFGRTIKSVAEKMVDTSDESRADIEAVYRSYGLSTEQDEEVLISYDLSGKNLGVVFHDVMQDVLGLEHVNLDEVADKTDPSELLFSYATETNVNGVERIVRIRQIKNNEEVDDPRQWSLLTPTGLILDAQLSFGAEEIKPDDQVLLPGTGISLAFVRDADSDGIPARLEYLHGCSDKLVDTDGDGLTDYQEVFGAPKNADGAYIDINDKWDIDVKGIGNYEGFSSCTSLDTDDDGISDFMEYGYEKDLDPDDPAADEPSDIARDRLSATDAKKRDTDDDGITDYDEINGYIAQLEFPRVTTGDDPSECIDRPDDTVIGNITLDKVFCTTDPLSPSSDGDALPDGDELVFHSDPTRKDAGDISDIDGDGLLGREETDGWPVTFLYYKPTIIGDYHEMTCDEKGYGCTKNQIVDCITGTTCRLIYEFDTYGGLRPTSDPTDYDTDGDGLWDSLEQDISQEPNSIYTGGTHPRVVDTDLDGRSDYEELMGFPYLPSELDASKPYQGTVDNPVRTNPLGQDTDGDGLSDGNEVNVPWDVKVLGEEKVTVYSDPRTAHSDADTLDDAQEKAAGSNPHIANTDGDAYALDDDTEVGLGMNPVDPKDICIKITFTGVSCNWCSKKEVDISIYPEESGIWGPRAHFIGEYDGSSSPHVYMNLDQLQNAVVRIDDVDFWDTVNVLYEDPRAKNAYHLIADYDEESLQRSHFLDWDSTYFPRADSSLRVNWNTSVMIEQNLQNKPNEPYCN